MRGLAAACVGLALVLAGCGGKNDAAPVDACPRADAGKRELAGAFVRAPVGTGLFEVLAVQGWNKRGGGGVGKLRLGDYTFKARGEAEGGGLEGKRGARAVPVAGFGAAGFLDAFAVSYSTKGKPFAGLVAVGKPTPGSKLPTSGQGHFSGPVRLEVRGAAGEMALVGRANVAVRFGSREVVVALADLRPEAAGVAPFAALDWTGIGSCGVRLGSNGQGGFRTLNAGGAPVNFAGPSDVSPTGSAVIDASFYGFDAASAQPEGVGGVLLVQGDDGVIAGIFAAGRTD